MSTFQGVPKTQATAEAVIRDTLSHPVKVFVGDTKIDVYNASGQGVRIDKATRTFDTFLERSLEKVK